MNKNYAKKLKGLDGDLAVVEAKIAKEIEDNELRKRELARLKFTAATSSTLARNGGQFPPDGFNI